MTSQQLKVILIGFVGMVFLYILLTFSIVNGYIDYQDFPMRDSYDNKLLFWIFVILSISGIVLSPYLSKYWYNKRYDSQEIEKAKALLRFAFAEASGIFGLFIFLMTGIFTWTLILCGIAIVGLIISYPNKQNALETTDFL